MSAPTAGRRIEAIAIGTSAGGVDALLRILPALPAGTAVMVFVVLHLPAARTARWTEIYAARCAMPVRVPDDKEPAAPGVIYFAPHDYHLQLEPGARIALSADAPVQHSRPSIDVLFETAADVFADRLVAILLTGANTDGSDGLVEVRRRGGYVVVQDPGDAECRTMVLSALARLTPDACLPLEGIAALLARVGRGGEP